MQTATRQITKRSVISPQLRREIRFEVYQAIEDLGVDPDEGLELRPEFVRELKKRIVSKEKGTPLAEVMKLYGLKA